MAIVEYEIKNKHLVVITLNKPDRLNAIDDAMMLALREAWIRYDNDDDAWIAILTGRGRAFSAGADKSWFEKTVSGEASPEAFLNLIRKDPYWSGKLDKPVITAVNGFAVGAGLDLVLRSDLRIAAEAAWFQQPEVERGTIMLFNDNLPYAIAAEMIAGFRISSRRAYDVGMINRLVSDDDLLKATEEIADELLARVPLALFHALKLLRDIKNGGVVVPQRLIDNYTTVLSEKLVHTVDGQEAIQSMIDKRKPDFRKR